MAKLKENPTSRIWIACTFFAILFGGGYWFVHSASSSDVRPLHRPLSELDRVIGDWTGEDHEMDERVASRVNAQDSVSRLYTNSRQQLISLHIASWDSLGEPTLPHPPAVCYKASGATVGRQEVITVGTEEPIEARMLSVNREGNKSLVLYWYCWGDSVCTTRGEACRIRLRLLTRRSWPPLLKVMLEVSVDPSDDNTKQRLLDFATVIRDWTKNL